MLSTFTLVCNKYDLSTITYSKVSPSSTVSASTIAASDMANEEPNFGTNARVPILRLMGTFDGAKALTATVDANRMAAALESFMMTLFIDDTRL